MIKAASLQVRQICGRVRLKKKLFLSLCLAANCMFSVHADDPAQPDQENLMTIKIIINQQSYEVELEDNPTTKAFIKQLPPTLTMQELNGNEKFADLPHALPTNPISPETLHKGDFMLYGSQNLVLFHDTFRTTYSYTPIGRVITSDTLQDTVGHSSIT